jgi:pyruvate formate-lyase/glycerol dehydratase family glycyl radical enzyme
MSPEIVRINTEQDDRLDLSDLNAIGPVPRLQKIRDDILESQYTVCTQKAELMTEYFRQHFKKDNLVNAVAAVHWRLYQKSIFQSARGQKQKPWQVDLGNRLNRWYQKRWNLSPNDLMVHFAKALAYILDRMELKVYGHELIVGNSSSARVGAPIHPDLGGLLMLPELDDIAVRDQNPMALDPESLRRLKEEIFPFWFNKSVLAMTPLYTRNPDLLGQMLDGAYFVLTQFAGISHVTPDYEKVVQVGFEGIKTEILEALVEVNQELTIAASRAGTSTENIEKLKNQRAFLQSALISTNAAVRYGQRWRRHLEALTRDESDPMRKAELAEMADLFSRIPAKGAQTFHQAVQSLFLAHVIVHQESFQHGVSFGRVDQYLYPYYQRDIENGRLTPEKAVEILGCFIAKAGELLPLFFKRATEYFSGLSSASGLTLGGRTPDGRDGVNELSYLFLQAYDRVRLRQPNFHVRVDEQTPESFFRLCSRVLAKGGGIPAFFNDQGIVPALVNVGASETDATDYSIVGCVEWGVPKKSFPAAGAIFLNLPMALHLALNNGRLNGSQFGPDTGSADSFHSLDDIIRAFNTQLSHLIEVAVEGNNAIETAHARHRPTPFLSAIVDGCIRKRKEINSGGAVYNTTGCQGVGLADVVDSLAAIDKWIFQEKRLTISELVRVLHDDFRGREPLQQELLNKTAKYGENRDNAGIGVDRVSGIYAREVFRHSNIRDGKYVAGFWSMTTHQGFGARMPALPSGRRAGEPLANGVSPTNIGDRLGPTSALASAAHVDGRYIGNGYALNQKFNPELLKRPGGERLLEWLIRGFFRQGGMQVQFNIVDSHILVDARNHPEKHPGLVVRVSGYSAYFNDLTPLMKDELIARTHHNDLGNGCC